MCIYLCMCTKICSLKRNLRKRQKIFPINILWYQWKVTNHRGVCNKYQCDSNMNISSEKYIFIICNLDIVTGNPHSLVIILKEALYFWLLMLIISIFKLRHISGKNCMKYNFVLDLSSTYHNNDMSHLKEIPNIMIFFYCATIGTYVKHTWVCMIVLC